MNYKKGENHMLNNMNQIYFINKECKNRNHFLCQYQWKGFGFQIICKCECHKKLVLGRIESLPNTINLLSNRSSKEDEL